MNIRDRISLALQKHGFPNGELDIDIVEDWVWDGISDSELEALVLEIG